MARVAVTFAVNNLNTKSENIWGVIDHFENPENDFGGKRIFEAESKFINDSCAVLVFDMSSREPYQECATSRLSDGQVMELQNLMQETTTIRMKGSIFNDKSFNNTKLQVLARRYQVTININDEVLQVTGTWNKIAEFRKILNEEISEFLARNTTALVTLQADQEQENIIDDAKSSAEKGIIHVGSLNNDVLALMEKCGIYKYDHLTYDTEGGRVIISCPGDEDTASRIADAFQTEYRQLMMGGKLKEFSFPILNVNNKQNIEQLVMKFNNDYPQSVFKFDQENKVIKCLSMNARQIGHIRAKVKDLLEKPDDATAPASDSVGDTPTSMSLTLPGGRRVTLKQADIVEEAVDVIVNAANERLSHDGGVAAAIDKASYYRIQAFSTALVQQRGNLTTGQVVYTEAGGALKCKYVIHTVGPEGYKHGEQCQHLLWTACMNTLQLAGHLKATSLAMPPISTGIFGVPKDLVAKTIIQAVCSYPGYTEGTLQDIRIVIIDKETYKAFQPHFIDMRANWSAGVATTRPPIPFQQNHSWPDGGSAINNNPPASPKGKFLPPLSPKDQCPVCKGTINDPVTTRCQHKYCRGCLARSLHDSPYCAVCRAQLRDITGNQPDGGRMSHQILKQGLPGYDVYGTIKITYYIPSGIQGPNHPHPGRQFSGDTRYAYLPNSHEGNEVLTLLKRAFDAKLLFTVGKSATSNKDNRIIWGGDIEQKSCTHGGPQSYGYPDQGYLKRVKEQLRQKGISSYDTQI